VTVLEFRKKQDSKGNGASNSRLFTLTFLGVSLLISLTSKGRHRPVSADPGPDFHFGRLRAIRPELESGSRIAARIPSGCFFLPRSLLLRPTLRTASAPAHFRLWGSLRSVFHSLTIRQRARHLPQLRRHPAAVEVRVRALDFWPLLAREDQLRRRATPSDAWSMTAAPIIGSRSPPGRAPVTGASSSTGSSSCTALSAGSQFVRI
jgi:hypothetical protein